MAAPPPAYNAGYPPTQPAYGYEPQKPAQAGYAPQVPQTGYAAPQQGYVPPTAAPVQQGVYVQVAGPETVGATAGQAYYKAARVIDCGAMIRKGFLRKVYGILFAQLACTVAICAIFMYNSKASNFMLSHPGLALGSIFVSLVFLIILFCVRNKHPLNMYCLFIWTFLEAFTVAFVCTAYVRQCSATPMFIGQSTSSVCNGEYLTIDPVGQRAVIMAFAVTSGIFLVLTLFTLQSKIDFGFMGMGLSAALFIFIFWGFFMWGFGYQTYYLYSLFGAILFSLLIIFDTWLISKKMGPDEYILAAVNLYLDFINLFLYILALFGGSRN